MEKNIKLQHLSRFDVARSNLFDDIKNYDELEKAINAYGILNDVKNSQKYNDAIGAAFEVFVEFFAKYFNDDVNFGVKDIQDTSQNKWQVGYDFKFISTKDNARGIIQVKFRNDPTYRFDRNSLGTMMSIADELDIPKTHRILFTNLYGQDIFHFSYQNGSKQMKVFDANVQISFINKTSDFWQVFCATIQDIKTFQKTFIKPYDRREHQEIVHQACQKVMTNEISRGRVIVATGGGKSLNEFYLLEQGFNEFNHRIQVIVAPTIALLIQHRNTFEGWGLFQNDVVEVHFRTGDQVDNDDSINCRQTTSAGELLHILEQNPTKKILIFTTYVSDDNLFEIFSNNNIKVDLTIWDEFHRLMSQTKYNKNYLENIPSNKQLFFSASEKRGRIVDSNDESLFGPKLANITYAYLRSKGILVPKIKIKVIEPSKGYWLNTSLTKEQQFACDQEKINIKDVTREAASIVIAYKDLKSQGIIANMITFSKSVSICKKIVESQVVRDEIGEDVHLDAVYAAVPGVERQKIFENCRTFKHSILCQHSILKEGIDVTTFNALVLSRTLEYTSLQQSIGRIVRADPRDTLALERGEISLNDLIGWHKFYATIYIIKHDEELDNFKNIVVDICEKLQESGLTINDFEFCDIVEERYSVNKYNIEDALTNPEYDKSLTEITEESFSKIFNDLKIKVLMEQKQLEYINEDLTDIELITRLKSSVGIEREALNHKMNSRLKETRMDDDIKEVCVPCDNEITIDMCSRIELGKKIVIMSDPGFVSTLLTMGHDVQNIVFICHTVADEMFANNLGIKTLLVHYSDLKLKIDEIKHIISNMDYIVGNPPYNGISRKDVPKEFDEFIDTSSKKFQSEIPFIALAKNLPIGGKMIFITPNKWLSNKGCKFLREKLFSIGKLNYVKIQNQPQEWDGIVAIGQVSIFELEIGKETHAQDIICIDNRIPNIQHELDIQILQKIFSLTQYEKITCFLGSIGDEIKTSNNCEEINYVDRYNEHKRARLVLKDNVKSYIEKAKQNNQMFLLYPDFQRAPFKITGKNENRVKIKVEYVEPQPCTSALIIVPTKEPKKCMKLLECNVAKFIWTMFTTSRHYASCVNNLFPDILSILNDDFSDNDVYKIFNLNEQEIKHIEKMSLVFGKRDV